MRRAIGHVGGGHAQQSWDRETIQILIAGAGLGGLATASCLMRAGHKVEIHEQAPQLGEVGAGIQISANAMHVVRHLGLEQAVTRIGVRPGAYVFRLYDTGEVIQRYPLSDEHERMHGLLGDAAHPTLPYLAQGAVMAIEDGAILARAFAISDSIPAALQLYQRNRVERTARIVQQSSANRMLFHLRSVTEIRAAFAKRKEGEERNHWLYSYNPMTVELT